MTNLGKLRLLPLLVYIMEICGDARYNSITKSTLCP